MNLHSGTGFAAAISVAVLVGMAVPGCNNQMRQQPEQEVEQVFELPCVDSSRIQTDKLCIELYDPVCGCDGNTYSNDCKAQVNGLIRWKAGPCPAEAPDSSAREAETPGAAGEERQ